MLLNPELPIPDVPLRIISTVPSQTELLHDLGLDESVIGITKFCVHPWSWHKQKQRIGGTKNLNIKTIIDLSPNLIIANKEENVKEQIEELATRFPIWLTDVNNWHDSIDMIRDVGRITRKFDQALEMIDSIKKEWEPLQQTTQPHRRVIYLIWKDPYMTIGGDTFINDLLLKAGFVNSFQSQKRYPSLTTEVIVASDAEYIFLSSEPYPFSEKHVTDLSKQWQGKKIRLVDGEMFSWYGSRLLKSASYLKNFQSELS